MLDAAVAAAGEQVRLVGVTVLTSHDAQGFSEVVGRRVPDLGAEVERLARLTAEAGLAGVVCSPAEVALMRRILPAEARIVVPGIRRAGDRIGDQARVATPGAAVAAGATHLVVGRPIIEAADSAAAFRHFLDEARCPSPMD
jgi:orotidine-5'-phosphate decarboxylase